ncbi:MAG TPA: hypothetical protein VF930_04875 [Stellaceae bacterium]
MTPMASSSTGRATAALTVSKKIARRCPQSRHIAAQNIARTRPPSIAVAGAAALGTNLRLHLLSKVRAAGPQPIRTNQKDFVMKHLLSGVALAALLTVGLPALAQTSSSDKPPPAAPSDTSTTGAKTSMPAGNDSTQSGATSPSDSTDKSGKHARKRGAAAKHERSASDNMAEELNRQELQRVQSGGQTTGSGQSQAPGAGQTQGGGASGTR